MTEIAIDWSQKITAEDKAAAEQERRKAGLHAERDRRIASGKTFNLSFGPIPMRGNTFDQIVLQSILQRAMAKKMAGETAATILYRDADNTDRTLTPDEAIEMAETAMLWVQSVMQASWVMKDAGPIPSDFAEDGYWPA